MGEIRGDRGGEKDSRETQHSAMKFYKTYITTERFQNGVDQIGRKKSKIVETKHRVELEPSEILTSYMSKRNHLEDRLQGCLNLISMLLTEDSKETVLKNLAEEMDKGWFYHGGKVIDGWELEIED